MRRLHHTTASGRQPRLSPQAPDITRSTPTPELTIVIVNWNGGELLRRCLGSIADAPPSIPYDIVVVDNASADDSVRWLRSGEVPAALVGRLHVIENDTNVGFGRANNQAIAWTAAPLVLLLNADTEMARGAIDMLTGTLRGDPGIGACGPRLLNTDGSLQPSVWPNPPRPSVTVVEGLGLWRLIPRRTRGEWLLGRHWDHSRRRAVPLLFASAVLVRRAVFQQVGGFDERFHMYAEDDEWCLRARRAGWRLVFEPAAVVTHHGGRSSLQRWGARERLRTQLASSLQFQRLCLSDRQRLANLAAGCLVMAAHVLWRRLRGRPVDDVSLTLQMYAADLKRSLRER